jgi:hypothetical protein
MQTPSIFRRLILVGATSAALGLTTAAYAAPSLDPTGYANGSQNFHLVVLSPSLNESVDAGGFTGVQTGLFAPSGSTIDFWCYELTQFFNPADPPYTDYTLGTVTPAAANLALAELFSEAAVGGPTGAVATTALSAAVQLAIWEIKYDTGANPYSLSVGNFVVDGGDMTTRTLAQNLLNALSSTTPTYNVILLHSEGRQDFVTAIRGLNQTPEPSPLPLLGAGLAVMMLAMRRRSGKQI